MTKELLNELIQTMSHTEMASHLDISLNHLRRLLRVHNIKKPLKDKAGNSINLKYVENLHTAGYPTTKICAIVNATFDTIANYLNKDKNHISKNLLHHYFVDEKLSLTQIADRFGSAIPTIRKYLLLYEMVKPDIHIEKQDLELQVNKPIAELSTFFNTDKETIWYFLKKYDLSKKGKVNQEQLHQLYCVEHKSLQEIADHFKISSITLWRRIKQYKLTREFNPDLDLFEQKLSEYRDLPMHKAKQNLAKYYSVSLGEIEVFIKKHNLLKKRKRRKVTYTNDQLRKMFDRLGIKGLMKKLNMTEYNVKRALKRNGILPYTYSTKKLVLSIPKDRIEYLYHEKYKHYNAPSARQAMADELNLSLYAIKRYIQMYDLNRDLF